LAVLHGFAPRQVARFSTIGTRSYTYDDRLHVLPIDRLWTPALTATEQ